MAKQRARRVTIKKDKRGEWRYDVQGGNWKTVDAPEEGFASLTRVIERLFNRWRHVEEVVKVDGDGERVTWEGKRDVKTFFADHGFE